MVTTIHGFSSAEIVPVFQKYNAEAYYVAISDADRHESLDYVATIHHGIDMRKFELGQGPGDYLLFFGRIHPEKGTAEAIDVAESADLPLILAGIVQDREYFEQFVEPRLDGERVRYLGPVGPDRRGDLLGGARALLHLVNFEEPFGFSVVEAMACGTPVIAHPRGSMPEIVRDGVNGFLVGSLEQAVAAVRASDSLGQEGDAGVGRAPLRLQPHGRRLSRRLSPGRRAPSRATRWRPQCPLTAGPRESVFGWASTTGRLGRRWAGGRTSTTRKSQPISRGSPRAVSTRSGSS